MCGAQVRRGAGGAGRRCGERAGRGAQVRGGALGAGARTDAGARGRGAQVPGSGAHREGAADSSVTAAARGSARPACLGRSPPRHSLRRPVLCEASSSSGAAPRRVVRLLR